MRDGDDTVRAQYEAFPYPERDPADEAKRLLEGSPSHLFEINHYIFAGRLDGAKPFRALVAGGGTGDGAIMLAQMLAWWNPRAEVVYLDISAAALEVTRARAGVRGLANMQFIRGSLLDLADFDLGRFDYIDCCGVLHHLADANAGLKTLFGALAEGGGMGLMLYGELGRIGVYHMQRMLRLIAPAGGTDDARGDAGDDDNARLAIAHRLLDGLPESNWLRRNPYIRDHREGGKAGLYDLFLHSRDRAYTVPKIADLAAAAGLEVSGFIEPAVYDPLDRLADPGLRARVAELPWIERCAFAELLGGNLKRHIFYLVEAGRGGAAVARPDDPRAVPRLRETSGPEMARELGGAGRISVELAGVKFSYPVSALGVAILVEIDGRRSLEEIQQRLAAAQQGTLDWLAFKAAFDKLYRALNGLNRMFIAYPPWPGG